MVIKKLYIIALSAFCLSSLALARPLAPTNDTTYEGLAPGGRSLAMGQAFCAMGEDPATIYYNCAGLTTVNKQYFSTTFEVTRQSALTSEQIFSSEMLKDNNLIFLGLISNSGAISWRPLANSVIHTVNGQDWTNTEVKVSQFTLSASHKNNPTLDTGLNISYISSKVAASGVQNNVPFADISDGNGVSLDLGMLYHISPQLNLGLNFQNVAGFVWWDDFEQEQLPFIFRVGFTFHIAQFLAFNTDVERKFYRGPLGTMQIVHFGFEQQLGQILALRGGFYGESISDPDKVKYTAGLGYNSENYALSLSGEKYKLSGTDVFRYLFSFDMPI